MTAVTPGWYPDPAVPAGQPVTRERFWDGAQWTHQVREVGPGPDPTTPTGGAVPPGPAARLPEPAPATGPPPADPAAQGSSRGSVIALTAASVVVLAVLGVGIAWWAGLGGLGTSDDAGSAGAEPGVPTSDPTDRDAPSGDGTDLEAGADADPAPAPDDDPEDAGPAPEPPAPEVDLDDLDPGSLSVRVSVGDVVEEVTLSGGQAVLADGSQLALIEDLLVRGDLTGEGRDQLALVFDVRRDEQLRPGLAVVGAGPDGQVVSLDPPRLTVQRDLDAPTLAERGFVDAASIVDGGLELRLVVPEQPGASLVVSETRGDPYADNLQAEMRYELVSGAWTARPDGPITRAAREHAASFYGVRYADELRCDGRADVRGRHPQCLGRVQDDPTDVLFVALLVVDDQGGFRSVLGRDGPLHAASDVRRELGPGEHFCRDIREEAEQSPIGWELPMAAVSYWFDEGMPERMDASRNGIPCQTVFDGVAEFLQGADGRVGERYARQRSGPG